MRSRPAELRQTLIYGCITYAGTRIQLFADTHWVGRTVIDIGFFGVFSQSVPSRQS